MTATSKRPGRKAPAGEKPAGEKPAGEKIEHPAKEFSHPAEVLTDRTLSAAQKRQALNSLEQDARQLAVASAEGMTGGEQTQLQDVLEAERSLEQPSSDGAFIAVLHTLEDQRHRTRGSDTEVLIERAIDAINRAWTAIAGRHSGPHVPPGAGETGS